MEPEICVRLRYPRQGCVFWVDELFDIFCALIGVKDESLFFLGTISLQRVVTSL